MTTLLGNEELIDPMELDVFRYVHRGTINRWLREGRLQSIRIGRKFLTTRSWVETFLVHEPKPTPKQDRPAKPKAIKPAQVVEVVVDETATRAISEARQAAIQAAMASVLGDGRKVRERASKRASK
jgi:excisionase family DNA binding protein